MSAVNPAGPRADPPTVKEGVVDETGRRVSKIAIDAFHSMPSLLSGRAELESTSVKAYGALAGDRSKIATLAIAAIAPSLRASKRFGSEYIDLIVRVKPEVMEAINAHIATIEHLVEKVDLLVAKIKKQDFVHDDFFKDNNLPYYALEAVRLGKISRLQFGTIMSFLQAISSYPSQPIEVVPLFTEEGKPNPKALAIISQDSSFFEEEKKLLDFFEVLKEMPESEQYLVLTPDHFASEAASEAPKPLTISKILLHVLNSNIFNTYVEYPGEDAISKRVVPSLGMMQAYIQERSKAAGITGAPFNMQVVLGESKPYQIHLNTLTSSRDVQVSFPGIETPEKADGFLAFGADFTYHDFYHSLIASLVPAEHRVLFSALYLSLAQIINKGKKEAAIATGDIKAAYFFKWTLIDMDHFLYFRHYFADTKTLSEEASYQIFIQTLLSRLSYSSQVEETIQILTGRPPIDLYNEAIPPGMSHETKKYLTEEIAKFLRCLSPDIVTKLKAAAFDYWSSYRESLYELKADRAALEASVSKHQSDYEKLTLHISKHTTPESEKDLLQPFVQEISEEKAKLKEKLASFDAIIEKRKQFLRLLNAFTSTLFDTK